MAVGAELVVPVGEEARLAVYRTAQEALANAGNHAGPGALVTLDSAYGGEVVTWTVSDAGGIGPGSASPGWPSAPPCTVTGSTGDAQLDPDRAAAPPGGPGLGRTHRYRDSA